MGKKFWITVAGAVVLVFVLLYFGFAAPADGCSAGGESFASAIVVSATTEDEGVPWEYEWLADNACPCNGGPSEVEQQDLEWQGEEVYDVLRVRCADGAVQSYYFEITNFFGNWE